jgi:hypothetical protein
MWLHGIVRVCVCVCVHEPHVHLCMHVCVYVLPVGLSPCTHQRDQNFRPYHPNHPAIGMKGGPASL